ncbi:MAG: PA2779 family protein [Deltaproteobacteria bacterium]|nr:PA2779 family protein [Deltaproteobacteria bacterium]
MSKKFFKSVTCLMLVMSLASLHFPHIVRAEMIGVQMLLDAQQRSEKIDKARTFLQREDVREQMVLLGADPDEAQLRVEALSDRELSLLAQQIDDLPAAAGAEALLAIVGIVFVVLLVLELVGVTNVFSRF